MSNLRNLHASQESACLRNLHAMSQESARQIRNLHAKCAAQESMRCAGISIALRKKISACLIPNICVPNPSYLNAKSQHPSSHSFRVALVDSDNSSFYSFVSVHTNGRTDGHKRTDGHSFPDHNV